MCRYNIEIDRPCPISIGISVNQGFLIRQGYKQQAPGVR